MKIVLFLGSGISLASGHPTVVSLTKNILDSGSNPKETRFLNALKDYNERAKSIGGTINASTNEAVGAIYGSSTSYEDLYYLCDEIASFDWGLHDNAMVPAFMESLVESFSPFLSGNTKEKRFLEIGRLAHAAKLYINKAIIDELIVPKEIQGLDLIAKLAKSPRVSSLEILSLNHDLLIEGLLHNNGIEFSDGFSQPNGDVCWFEPDTWLSSTKVKLIKLHGSIDWFTFSVNGYGRLGRVVSRGASELKDSNGNAFRFLIKTPNVLSGSNKIKFYNSGIYTDIHYHFQRVLYHNSLMIMSGYGWGDDPINNRLMTWLDKMSENKLILLHEDPGALMKRSMVFDRDYSNWEKLGKLKPMGKWLSSAGLEEVIDACSQPALSLRDI